MFTCPYHAPAAAASVSLGIHLLIIVVIYHSLHKVSVNSEKCPSQFSPRVQSDIFIFLPLSDYSCEIHNLFTVVIVIFYSNLERQWLMFSPIHIYNNVFLINQFI